MIPFSFASIIRSALYDIVNEKTERYKEYLRINGASSFAYLVSFFIFYLIRTLIICVIMSIGLGVIGFYSHANVAVPSFVISYIAYGLASICFCMALTTLFSSPKIASGFGSSILLLGNFLLLYILRQTSSVYYYIGAILPTLDLSLGMANTPYFTVTNSILMQLANCLIYFGLFMYLDRVIPNEYGIRDPCCTCKKRNRVKSEPIDLSTNVDPKPLMGIVEEDHSSALYHEHFDNQKNNMVYLGYSDSRVIVPTFLLLHLLLHNHHDYLLLS